MSLTEAHLKVIVLIVMLFSMTDMASAQQGLAPDVTFTQKVRIVTKMRRITGVLDAKIEQKGRDVRLITFIDRGIDSRAMWREIGKEFLATTRQHTVNMGNTDRSVYDFIIEIRNANGQFLISGLMPNDQEEIIWSNDVQMNSTADQTSSDNNTQTKSSEKNKDTPERKMDKLDQMDFLN